MRQASILRRRAAPDVAAWLDSLGLERAAGPVAVPANPALGMAARTCAPVRDGGVLLAFLWVLGPVDEAGLAAVAATAGALGAGLGRRRRREDEHRRALAGRLAAALAGDAEAARALVADAGWPPGAQPVVALVDDDEAAERARRRVALVRTAHAGRVAVAAPVPAAELAAALVAAGAPHAAAGRPAAPDALPVSLRQAEHAALAARADPRLGAAVTHEALGAWAAVVELWLAAGRRAVPTPVDALDGVRHGEELAVALEAVLDAAGDVTAAATLLHVHRATLYRRLERVEALTGLDLERGDDRLLAHLGLRLRRLSRLER